MTDTEASEGKAANATPSKLMLHAARRKPVMDNIGVRIAREDGNRLKQYCVVRKVTLGIAIKQLLNYRGIGPDGRVRTKKKESPK